MCRMRKLNCNKGNRQTMIVHTITFIQCFCRNDDEVHLHFEIHICNKLFCRIISILEIGNKVLLRFAM